MIKANSRYSDGKLRIHYTNFSGSNDQTQPVKVSRNSAGSVLVSGHYVNENPDCDGGNLCGGKATHVITMLQYREAGFGGFANNTFNAIRNFMLLCPECLELYKSTDVMIGEPIDLVGFIRESKGV